ncbi:hypothetical protein [Candidatus Uabimicrobium sp. HlEnr_7]|uniref:hypothetical protein n=1 Tax=Candidatus Uabimicrobium helgolandensis TaxID=3095367 RepID=UPI0035564DAE
MKDIVNGKQLGVLFGITERAVLNLVEEGMPKRTRGKYSLTKCTQWYIEKLKTKNNGRASRVEKQNQS